MPEFLTLDQHGVHARVAACPVQVHEYLAYLRATGEPAPPGLAHVRVISDPVTYVAQVPAVAYCAWLGRQDGRPVRLPSVAELVELSGTAGQEGTSLELWPHTHSERPEIQGCRGELYLCEWTRETEQIPAYGGGAPRVLGSVFYPPWLRHGNNPTQIQAMMLNTQGYSFVSFRLATDL